MKNMNLKGCVVCVLFGTLTSSICYASPVSWIDSQWFAVGTKGEFGLGANANYNMVQTPPDQVSASASAEIFDFPSTLGEVWHAYSGVVVARRFSWGHLDGSIMELVATATGGMSGNSDYIGGGTEERYALGAYIGKLDPAKNCTASEVAGDAAGGQVVGDCISDIANYITWPFGTQNFPLNLGGTLVAGTFPLSATVDSLSEDLGSGVYAAVGWLSVGTSISGPLTTSDGSDLAYGRSTLTLQLDVNRAVPEPSTISLVALGLFGWFFRNKVTNKSRLIMDSGLVPGHAACCED